MNAETLLAILSKVPKDYEVRYQDKHIGNTFEIDVENQRIILK